MFDIEIIQNTVKAEEKDIVLRIIQLVVYI